MAVLHHYYYDNVNDVRWYVESYEMSTTEFARRVSKLVGYEVRSKDISEGDASKFRNARHI